MKGNRSLHQIYHVFPVSVSFPICSNPTACIVRGNVCISVFYVTCCTCITALHSACELLFDIDKSILSRFLRQLFLFYSFMLVLAKMFFSLNIWYVLTQAEVQADIYQI